VPSFHVLRNGAGHNPAQVDGETNGQKAGKPGVLKMEAPNSGIRL